MGECMHCVPKVPMCRDLLEERYISNGFVAGQMHEPCTTVKQRMIWSYPSRKTRYSIMVSLLMSSAFTVYYWFHF